MQQLYSYNIIIHKHFTLRNKQNIPEVLNMNVGMTPGTFCIDIYLINCSKYPVRLITFFINAYYILNIAENLLKIENHGTSCHDK